MIPKVDLNGLGQTKPHQYAVRFFFGGLITALAGWIATRFGPATAGLFLSFPAILPASVTLVQDHAQKNHNGRSSGQAKREAGDDSLGAAIGSLGLICFGLVVWAMADRLPLLAVLGLAGLAWLFVSIAGWVVAFGWQDQRKANS